MSKMKRTAFWLTCLALIVKLSGFLRESIIAKQFGVSEYTDGYLLAFSFITLILAMISGGFTNTFLPLYVKRLQEKTINAEKSANGILNISILLFVIITAVGYFLVPNIVALLYGKMTLVTEQVAIQVTRVFFLGLTFVALNAILDSYLQSRRIFVPAQFSKLLTTLTGAIFALLFSDIWGIYSLAYGFIIGVILGTCLQIYYLLKSGYKWSPSVYIEKEFKKSFLVLLIPALLNSVVGQINMFVDKMFASGAEAGAVTYLNNASLLVSIPHTIYGTTIAVIIFTLLSEQIHDKAKFEQTFFIGMQISYITLIPITVGLLIVGDVAIKFVFERGAFTAVDSYKTFLALLFYLPMIITQGLQYIVSKSMYARGKTSIILRISITTIIMNILLNSYFVKLFGYTGLAFSSSIVSLYYLSMTTFFLYKDFSPGAFRNLISMIIKGIPPILIMALLTYLTKIFTPIHQLNSLLQLFILGIVGASSYLVGLYLLNRTVYYQLLNLLKR